MENVTQLVLEGLIGGLLLYVGLVMRQFAKSVERLERVTEALRDSMSDNGERLARLEALMEEAGRAPS